MARPERKDVDYFPFYVKDGRTLFILEDRYGLKGIGFFTNMMRFLCRTPEHWFSISDEADRMFFFSRVKCDEEEGIDMLTLMAKTGKIHRQMWQDYRVIVSPDLLESLKDAYAKRRNQMITLDDIISFCTGNPTSTELPDPETTYQTNNRAGNDENDQNFSQTGADNAQRKEKKRKEKNNRGVNEFPTPETLDQKTWQEFVEMRKEIKKPLTYYACELIVQELDKINRQHGHDRNEVLRQSIRNDWQDVYPIKNGNGQKKEIDPPPVEKTSKCPKCGRQVEEWKLTEFACVICEPAPEGAAKELSKFISGFGAGPRQPLKIDEEARRKELKAQADRVMAGGA